MRHKPWFCHIQPCICEQEMSPLCHTFFIHNMGMAPALPSQNWWWGCNEVLSIKSCDEGCQLGELVQLTWRCLNVVLVKPLATWGKPLLLCGSWFLFPHIYPKLLGIPIVPRNGLASPGDCPLICISYSFDRGVGAGSCLGTG